jgi:ribose 5-phosphate isomerase
VEPIRNAEQLERDIRAIPGVVDSGLFLAMVHQVLVGAPDLTLLEERSRNP